MSRSYKKAPVYTDRPHGAKYWKRLANHKVRRNKDVFNGNGYRKIFNSWEIHDYVSYWTKDDAIDWYNKDHNKKWWFKDAETLDEYLNNHWEPYYHRK